MAPPGSSGLPHRRRRADEGAADLEDPRQDRNEGVDAGRIELRAALGADELDRGLDRMGGPPCPLGGHGIEDVGEADDAGRQGNAFAGEAVGIATAVVTLVMQRSQRRQRKRRFSLRCPSARR